MLHGVTGQLDLLVVGMALAWSLDVSSSTKGHMRRSGRDGSGRRSRTPRKPRASRRGKSGRPAAKWTCSLSVCGAALAHRWLYTKPSPGHQTGTREAPADRPPYVAAWRTSAVGRNCNAWNYPDVHVGDMGSPVWDNRSEVGPMAGRGRVAFINWPSGRGVTQGSMGISRGPLHDFRLDGSCGKACNESSAYGHSGATRELARRVTKASLQSAAIAGLFGRTVCIHGLATFNAQLPGPVASPGSCGGIVVLYSARWVGRSRRPWPRGGSRFDMRARVAMPLAGGVIGRCAGHWPGSACHLYGRRRYSETDTAPRDFIVDSRPHIDQEVMVVGGTFGSVRMPAAWLAARTYRPLATVQGDYGLGSVGLPAATEAEVVQHPCSSHHHPPGAPARRRHRQGERLPGFLHVGSEELVPQAGCGQQDKGVCNGFDNNGDHDRDQTGLNEKDRTHWTRGHCLPVCCLPPVSSPSPSPPATCHCCHRPTSDDEDDRNDDNNGGRYTEEEGITRVHMKANKEMCHEEKKKRRCAQNNEPLNSENPPDTKVGIRRSWQSNPARIGGQRFHGLEEEGGQERPRRAGPCWGDDADDDDGDVGDDDDNCGGGCCARGKGADAGAGVCDGGGNSRHKPGPVVSLVADWRLPCCCDGSRGDGDLTAVDPHPPPHPRWTYWRTGEACARGRKGACTGVGSAAKETRIPDQQRLDEHCYHGGVDHRVGKEVHCADNLRC